MKNTHQKTAYWTQKTRLLRADEFICSECGTVSNKGYGTCPDCGARMQISKIDPSWVDEAEYLDIFFGD